VDRLLFDHELKAYTPPTTITNKSYNTSMQDRLRRMMKEDGALREHIRYKMYPEDTKLYNQIKEEKL